MVNRERSEKICRCSPKIRLVFTAILDYLGSVMKKMKDRMRSLDQMVEKKPDVIFPIPSWSGYYLVVTPKPFRTDCCFIDSNNVSVPAGITILTASGTQERRLAKFRKKRKGVPYGTTYVKMHSDNGKWPMGKAWPLNKIVAKIAPSAEAEMNRRMAVMSEAEIREDQRKFVEATVIEAKAAAEFNKMNKEDNRDGEELEERKKYKGTTAEFNKLLKKRRALEDKEAKRLRRNERDRKSKALRDIL